MEQQEETFQVTVQINKGMEPTTLNVVAEENKVSGPEHALTFKIKRDKDSETLAVLAPDSDHCWQQLEGNMEQEEVDLIGAAIDGHYA
ncbi:formyltetrahydrofolate hydrolase [Pedobacter sp. AK017]|uniref:hypothetical protein n=1 Tax=Pedobacter sp. AK017 TaxID=2723073 RepID=UPI00161930BA|nr:hypothetical protein [Pedobacter sp. AK017]MBB5440603.1 formyltetrahydrofolate hydrolase [Pedobacter sp. AK017]